uniref:Uncharacterized protein n=1 Tax=Romanomermis culicivorax TaxID=13658 RepID=A0A915J9Z0_ROMCU
MIGQVATMQNRVISLAARHQSVVDNYKHTQEAALPEEPVSTEKPLDIAIVGMECIFPG